MCQVRTGTEVKNVADLQNLVTSVILRQTQPFSKVTIQNQVLDKLAGSKSFTDVNQVIGICDKTLKFMVLSSSIKSMGMDSDRYRLTLSFPSYNPSMMDVE